MQQEDSSDITDLETNDHRYKINGILSYYMEVYMKKVRLGNTELEVSPVGFGVMTINKFQLDLPLGQGAALIKYALDKGVNFFDTAQYYETYDYIREALKMYYEEDPDAPAPVICSKCLDAGYDEMRFAVKQALDEMCLDRIDIFLLHEVRGGTDFEDRAGAWEYLQEAKNEGLVRYIGISTHNVEAAEKMADIPECDIVFPLINYEGLGIRNGDGPGTSDEMASAIKDLSDKGKGLFAMKAFGGGNLTGDYVKALDYVFGLDGLECAMIGIGKKDEVDTMIAYAEGRLDKDYAPDVSEKKIYINQGDCEGCGACKKRCPNGAIFWNDEGLADVDHEICLTCGYCAPVCPVRAIIMY